MKPGRLYRRWGEGQRQLLDDLVRQVRRCRRAGAGDQVHALRVIARRLRLHLRLGCTLQDPKANRACLEWTRSIATLTSKVRDLDTAMEWLATIPDTQTLRDALQRRRRRHWNRRRLQLRYLPPRWLKVLSRIPPGRKRAEALRTRSRELEQRLRTRVARLAPRFFDLDPEQQHTLRRAVRRWRYLRELELPASRQSKDSRLRRLLLLQQQLGERQNLHLADSAIAPLPDAQRVSGLRQRITEDIARLESILRDTLSSLRL